MATQELAIIPERSLAKSNELLQPNNLAELQQLGGLMAASGFFSDSRSAAQACVKILAGREMGFPPIASMTGISIIDGKPSTGANLIAAAMKRAGYTWKVIQRDAKGCKLTVIYRNQEMGPAEFLEEDAKRANLLGKKNWLSWPRSMYFARAISEAAKTYAPEIFLGMPIYTADELGAVNTTEDGAALPEPVEHDHHGRGPLNAESEAVAQQKIAELSQPRNEPPPPPAIATAPAVVESGTGEGAAPNSAPAPVTNGTKLVPDAVMKLWQRAGKSFGECCEVFGELKFDLSEMTSNDEKYYEILNRHGMTAANDIKGKPARAWKAAMHDMYDFLVAGAFAEAEPQPAAEFLSNAEAFVEAANG